MITEGQIQVCILLEAEVG